MRPWIRRIFEIAAIWNGGMLGEDDNSGGRYFPVVGTGTGGHRPGRAVQKPPERPRLCRRRVCGKSRPASPAPNPNPGGARGRPPRRSPPSQAAAENRNRPRCAEPHAIPRRTEPLRITRRYRQESGGTGMPMTSGRIAIAVNIDRPAIAYESAPGPGRWLHSCRYRAWFEQYSARYERYGRALTALAAACVQPRSRPTTRLSL